MKGEREKKPDGRKEDGGREFPGFFVIHRARSLSEVKEIAAAPTHGHQFPRAGQDIRQGFRGKKW